MVHVREILDHPPSPAPATAPTSLAGLDDLTGGLRAGDLWIVTGHPGQGRTTLVSQWAGELAVRRGWAVWLGCPREDSHACSSRLLASLGALPFQELRTGDAEAGGATRLAATRNALRGADLWVEAGDVVTMPVALDGGPPRALFVDDAHLVLGAAPEYLRAAADEGALVVASLPRHLATRGADREADLLPRWAEVSDVIVEVRTVGLRPRDGSRTGEADLTLLRNRRGPLGVHPVANQGHYARFVDLGDAEAPAGPARPS